MSERKRTTISLHENIIAKAKELMAEDDFGDFSGFLEQLIREKWAAREMQLHDRPPRPTASPAPTEARPTGKPVSYTKPKRPRRN